LGLFAYKISSAEVDAPKVSWEVSYHLLQGKALGL